MYGWELLFSSWLMETRSLEVKHLATQKYLDAWCVFFWATTPSLFSLCTFGLFALMRHQLDAATVFTCLALFNTLISPLNSFPWVINGLIDVHWILFGTVRDNILFGKSYHPERYIDTIKVCALDVDISLMAGGDMAYIGDKGVNLSGGQRARLSLARVLYHDSDVIMLDDVLSAVDVQVAQWIFHNAILGPLMKGKTRLLCTHNIQVL